MRGASGSIGGSRAGTTLAAAAAVFAASTASPRPSHANTNNASASIATAPAAKATQGLVPLPVTLGITDASDSGFRDHGSHGVIPVR